MQKNKKKTTLWYKHNSNLESAGLEDKERLLQALLIITINDEQTSEKWR